MKRLLVVFVVLLTFQAVALASPKNIDLREYQQATGTINVLAAPFENDNFYLATFNFDEQNKGAIEVNWTFPLPEFLSTKNTYGIFQLYSGYGNNLIDYDREINKVGLGIAFSR